MLPVVYKNLVQSFIEKAAQDIGFHADVIEVMESEMTITFKSLFGFQVITDTETEKGIEWRYVPVHTTYDVMGIMRMVGDNHFDTLFNGVVGKIRLQEPGVKAHSVLYIGQTIKQDLL